MKNVLAIFTIIFALAGGLAACDDNEATSDQVGEAVEDTGEATGEAAEETGEAAEEAGEEAGEAAEGAQE